MHLVQDLVDYITDFLHDDPATLMQTSLVSKAWVGRARVHLCETMNITNRKLVSLRLSYLTPLSGYVKTLYFPWPRDITKLPALLDCFEQSEPHTLAIDCWEAGNLDEQGVLGCFVKFPCLSITSLELLDVYPTLATPLILLPLFSNVDDLTISMCAWSRAMLIPVESEGRNDEITQTTSLPCLRGSFMFLDPPSNPWGFRRDILHTVAALPLQFQAVSLEINRQSLEDSLDLLNSCSKTVREVSVEVSERRTPTGMEVPPTVDRPPINFASLEELHIDVWTVGNLVPREGLGTHSLLKSVISPCLQRVTLRVRDRSDVAPIGWPLLDENLAILVERHKAYGNFTLRIGMGTDTERVRRFFPRVAQLGVWEAL